MLLARYIPHPSVCRVRGRDYDYYQPGYRYGYEAANRYRDRSWNEVEGDLSRDWNAYEHRGTSSGNR